MSASDLPGWKVESRTYESSGLNLHYLDVQRNRPRRDGRTMLAIHGLGANGDSWLPTIRLLNAVDRVIAPDLRGHGLSSWTQDGYWLRDYADDVVRLVKRLGLERIDLIGMSMGARVAMLLGSRLAPLLTTVAFVDTGPEVTRESARKAQEFAPAAPEGGARTDGFRDRDELMRFLKAKWIGFEPEALEIRADSLYRRNWVGRLVYRGDPETSWYLGSAGLKEVDEMWKCLRDIPVGTLIIHASQSFLLDESLCERMIAALRKPVYRRLDVDHFMMHTHIDVFGAVVDDFLESNRPAGATPQPTRKGEPVNVLTDTRVGQPQPGKR
jgi:pimeloyl-ACP methyl ester carboxylesterase